MKRVEGGGPGYFGACASCPARISDQNTFMFSCNPRILVDRGIKTPTGCNNLEAKIITGQSKEGGPNQRDPHTVYMQRKEAESRVKFY